MLGAARSEDTEPGSQPREGSQAGKCRSAWKFETTFAYILDRCGVNLGVRANMSLCHPMKAFESFL
jgi:hypothetical protein